MDNRVSVLEDLVETLQNEVEQLRADVNRLQRRLNRTEVTNVETSSQASGSVLDSPGASVRSSGYSLVTSTPLDRVIEAVGEPPPVLSWEEREAICDQIGVWVRRSLQGHHRGASGRDRIPLASRVWVVAQDFFGNQFDGSVRIFHSFGACRDLVKRGSSCGSSVFLGLPSEREARRVCLSAGLRWPA